MHSTFDFLQCCSFSLQHFSISNFHLSNHHPVPVALQMYSLKNRLCSSHGISSWVWNRTKWFLALKYFLLELYRWLVLWKDKATLKIRWTQSYVSFQVCNMNWRAIQKNLMIKWNSDFQTGRTWKLLPQKIHIFYLIHYKIISLVSFIILMNSLLLSKNSKNCLCKSIPMILPYSFSLVFPYQLFDF